MFVVRTHHPVHEIYAIASDEHVHAKVLHIVNAGGGQFAHMNNSAGSGISICSCCTAALAVRQCLAAKPPVYAT